MVDPRAKVGDSTVGLYITVGYIVNTKGIRSYDPQQRTGPVSCVTVVESQKERPFFLRHTFNRDLQNFLELEHHDLTSLIQGILITCFFSTEPTRGDKKWTFGENEVSTFDVAFGKDALAHIWSRSDLI